MKIKINKQGYYFILGISDDKACNALRPLLLPLTSIHEFGENTMKVGITPVQIISIT